MTLRRRLSVASSLALALAAPTGCAPSAVDDGRGFSGPGVEIQAAALNLEGVGDVVWDLEVLSGDAGSGTVFQRRITSSGYGDSAGSASFVGPCDAGAGANPNTVKVWVVGVYDQDVASADAGSFAYGDPSGVTGAALAFQNPTTPGAAGALTRTFACVEGTDVAVQFDVALMRPAQQGFFDIAVNFNNIFCSAKLDCCDDGDSSGTCASPGEDLRLLFDASGARARTMVLGFACTAGTGDGRATSLYMDDLAFDCSDPASGFAADFTISPAGVLGNQCSAGSLAGCGAVDQLTATLADTYLYQVAVFRGDELVQSEGVAANKVYWNVALGVKGTIGACELRTRATADDPDNDLDGLVDGTLAAGAVYPFVTWQANLGACAEEPLSFDGTTDVRTAYSQTGGGADTFGYGFAPGLPAAPVCALPCEHGGSCTAPDTCTCLDGFGGAQCQNITVASSCKALHDGGVTQSGVYTLDPDGAGVLASFQAYCDMETDGGGWTMCWTDNGRVHMRSEVTYSASFPYGTDGYRSDCRNIPFTEVLYVDEAQLVPASRYAWFSRDTPGALVAGTAAADWNRTGDASGTFTGHGAAAAASYSFQLLFCDDVWMQTGLFISGYTVYQSSLCWKGCGYWCYDTTSAYFRPDGDYDPDSGSFHGAAFNQNGHTNLPVKLLSVGIR